MEVLCKPQRISPSIHTLITLFSHVGQFHDLGICHLNSISPSNKPGIFVYYSYIQAQLENLGGVILPTLCARSIVRPSNICKKNLFIPLLFIATLSLKISTLFTIFLLIKLAIFIIRTGVSFFLILVFSMNVR